jgi:hypothetical protein
MERGAATRALRREVAAFFDRPPCTLLGYEVMKICTRANDEKTAPMERRRRLFGGGGGLAIERGSTINEGSQEYRH